MDSPRYRHYGNDGEKMPCGDCESETATPPNSSCAFSPHARGQFLKQKERFLRALTRHRVIPMLHNDSVWWDRVNLAKKCCPQSIPNASKTAAGCRINTIFITHNLCSNLYGLTVG